jgi:glycosyltransferase involved in cell wall biosynthesis
MQAGTPVIVSSRGGAIEIVDDGQGRVVDPFDTPALAASIRGLLDDKSVRDLLGAAGRKRAAAFDWDVISAAYRSVYRSAVGARRWPRRQLQAGGPG